MTLGKFTASEDLDEETKQECVQQIEHAMKNYCDDCDAETVDNIQDACIKHKRMYGTYYP